MASLVLGGIGAAAAIPYGPGAIAIGFQVGAFLGGLFGPKQHLAPRGKVDDLRITSSSYGSTIPICYGSTLVGANLIWSTDLVQTQHTVQQGKGLSGPSQDEFLYSVSFAISVCAGPVHAVGRIWAEDVLVYDPSQSKPSRYNIHPPYLGGEGQTPDSLLESYLGVGNTPAYRGQCYVVFEALPLASWGNRIPNITVEVLGDPLVQTDVRGILEDVAARCGLSVDDDCYFGPAAAVVEGYVIPQRSQGVEAVQALLDSFQIDLCEVNGVIIAQARGGPAVATISRADLGARDWSSGDQTAPPPTIETTRAQELSLPGEVDYGYIDSGRRYEQMTQKAINYTRPDVQEPSSYSTNITMSATQARRVAERMLHNQWLERDSHAIQLGPKWAWLAPTSVVNLTLGSLQRRLRVVSIDSSTFSEANLKLAPDDAGIDDGLFNQSSYINSTITRGATRRGSFDVGGGRSTGYSAPSAAKAIATLSQPLEFDAWSGTELVAADGSSPGFYVIASGQGGTAYYSADGGATWTVAGSVPGAGTFGATTTTLANGPGTPDTTDGSTVNVTLHTGGPLTSSSAGGVANGENVALVGNEVVSYQTVAAADSLHYTLSGLTRGRRASPQVGHATGDRFWVLNSSVSRFKVPASAVGATVEVKVLAAGQSLSDVAAVNVPIPTPVAPYVDQPTLAAAIAGIPGAPRKLVAALCEAFTPASTGADAAEVTVPGSGLTFTLTKVTLRVAAAGGAPAITVQKSTVAGVFTPTSIGSVTLGSGAYEGSSTSSLGTVASGDKIRFSVGALGTAAGWTVTVEATT